MVKLDYYQDAQRVLTHNFKMNSSFFHINKSYSFKFTNSNSIKENKSIINL